MVIIQPNPAALLNIAPSSRHSCESQEALFKQIDRVIRGETSSPLHEPRQASIHRLKNFLGYTLAVDYAPPSPDARTLLNDADSQHFLEVSSYFVRYNELKDKAVPAPKDSAFLAAYFWTHVHAPARALGLPSEYVVAAIWRFSSMSLEDGTHGGSVQCIFAIQGLQGLADKFLFDRSVAIPRASRDRAFERALLSALAATQAVHFLSLKGSAVGTGTLEGGGGDGGGWSHTRGIAWEETEYSEQYVRQQKQAFRILEEQRETLEREDLAMRSAESNLWTSRSDFAAGRNVAREAVAHGRLPRYQPSPPDRTISLSRKHRKPSALGEIVGKCLQRMCLKPQNAGVQQNSRDAPARGRWRSVFHIPIFFEREC